MLKSLWDNRSKFPYDKIGHCIFVGFLPTLILGWGYGVYGSIGTEAVQIESGHIDLKDSLLDLIADGIGIGIALIVRAL